MHRVRPVLPSRESRRRTITDSLEVRPARETDLPGIASIGSESFSGLRPLAAANRWVQSCWAAQPRMRYWIAQQLDAPVGYILWMEKGGFRKDAVVELEQIAVRPSLRGQGIGTLLVRCSLERLTRLIEAEDRRVKVIEVTTGAEQGAVEFYRRTLGAEVVAKVPGLFRGDEFILVARPGAHVRP